MCACRKELHALLQEERLFGATLLILANKQDIPAALSLQEIEQVRTSPQQHCWKPHDMWL
jgi:ADP-ribosylation factor-like protein 2